jgi:hypothetical protein
VIHCLAPDFRKTTHIKPDQAASILAPVYRNVLREFNFGRQHRLWIAQRRFGNDVAATEHSTPILPTCLRLLPISSGIFAGNLTPHMPDITHTALVMAFDSLLEPERLSLRYGPVVRDFHVQDSALNRRFPPEI